MPFPFGFSNDKLTFLKWYFDLTCWLKQSPVILSFQKSHLEKSVVHTIIIICIQKEHFPLTLITERGGPGSSPGAWGCGVSSQETGCGAAAAKRLPGQSKGRVCPWWMLCHGSMVRYLNYFNLLLSLLPSIGILNDFWHISLCVLTANFRHEIVMTDYNIQIIIWVIQTIHSTKYATFEIRH